MLLLILWDYFREKRGRRKDQGLCLGDPCLMEQCGYLHLIAMRAQEQQYIFHSLSQRLIAVSQLLGTGCWDTHRGKLWLHLPEDQGASRSSTAPGAGQAKTLCEWPTCALGQKLIPQRVRRELLPFFSAPLQQRWHEPWYPTLLKPWLMPVASGVPGTQVLRFNPVRQFLWPFTKSIQESSQQRKCWHVGWSLNSFFSFFFSGVFIFIFFPINFFAGSVM